jgi:hypothetical protein
LQEEEQMKSFMFSGLIVALMCGVGPAFADETPSKHPLRIGFGADVGVPSGVALGAVVHPKIDWVSVQLSLTHNAMAFGGRASVKLDPLALFPNVPIGLFGDFQGGLTGQGNIHSDLPSVGYQYVNLYGGLRLGKPNNFHWNFEVGPSYIHASTQGFQAFAVNNGATGVTVSEPSIRAWVTPTFITGFEVVW